MKTDVQKLYLSSWQYNAALILTELENIVKNNGGKICKTWSYGAPPEWITHRKKYEIVNRSLTGAISEARQRLERLEALSRTDAATAYREELKQLENIDNTPRILYYGDLHYISFTLNNCYYYYQLDSNPFFDFYYTKKVIYDDNKILNCCYSDGDAKKWWKDIFYSFRCTPAERRAAAEMIFNMLTAAPTSRKYTAKNQKEYTKIYYTED